MRCIFLGCFLWLLVACSDSESIPSDVYPPAKMEKIFWDMLLADRYSALVLSKDSAQRNLKEETFKTYEKVFSIHRTNKAEFVRSFSYYLSRPDLTSVMFDSLYTRASKQRIESYQKYR